MNRRTFMAVAAAGLANAQEVPEAIRKLRPMLDGVVPITDDERRARVAKAQRLMQENKLDAIVLESGTSMFYFTGTRGSTGERVFALVIPAKGELAWVVPSAVPPLSQEMRTTRRGGSGRSRTRSARAAPSTRAALPVSS